MNHISVFNLTVRSELTELLVTTSQTSRDCFSILNIKPLLITFHFPIQQVWIDTVQLNRYWASLSLDLLCGMWGRNPLQYITGLSCINKNIWKKINNKRIKKSKGRLTFSHSFCAKFLLAVQNALNLLSKQIAHLRNSMMYTLSSLTKSCKKPKYTTTKPCNICKRVLLLVEKKGDAASMRNNRRFDTHRWHH